MASENPAPNEAQSSQAPSVQPSVPVNQPPPALDPSLPKKLQDLLAQVTEKDLREPEPAAETMKGNTQTPNVWVTGPAIFRFSALAQRRLTKVARQLGMTDTQVSRIHAKFVGDSNTVLIRPADALDLTAIELNMYPGNSGGTANLYSLLGPARATVESGYRQRYDVHLVPQGAAIWPGLLIDLDDPKARRVAKSEDEEESEETK